LLEGRQTLNFRSARPSIFNRLERAEMRCSPLHFATTLTREVKERDGCVDEYLTVIGTITLPGVERSVAQARRFGRDLLGHDHPSIGDIEVCVSEAFTNGVQHTASGRGGKVTVTFRAATDTIVAEVTDDGAGGARPHLLNEPESLRGRGMRIIDGLALHWGLRPDGERTTVWMRFPGPIPLLP
jgi:anti-sigma regulatory factor (Ser/Thr protein kinase)